MCPQIAFLNRCKIALFAFVRLFSTVRFQMCPQTACLWGCTVTLVTFFYFSPLCVLKCALKLPARDESKSHWLHLFGFSPLCVFKCLLKLNAWEHVKSHWLYLFDLSLLCVFKCLLISPSFENAKSHWVHLFAFSPASQCVFSNCLHERMRSNTDCICTTSLH